MTTNDWSTQDAESLYAVPFWGEGYFSINAAGHVCVKPRQDSEIQIDLFEVAQALKKRLLSFPVLLRFPDILRDRIFQLHKAFQESCQRYDYDGQYLPVYPIKVNQQGTVVENIIAAKNIGLEAGSKPELLAILGLSRQGVIVCNGYKDKAYVRMALIGQKMGQTVFIVIEKPSELTLILQQAAELGVEPCLGIRIRLSTISAGKWQNSGGEKSKFGLHPVDVLALIERLKQAGKLDILRLIHFHMGSQIANIHDIKLALKEASQFFVQLRRLGVPIATIDVGGGLGVDYDGSHSRRECSVNYSLAEYADNIVATFAECCRKQGLPQPDIITESGRAITAHHAVLITNVADVERYPEKTAQNNAYTQPNLLETWHNVQFEISEVRQMFVQGDIDLHRLAQHEQQYIQAIQRIRRSLDMSIYSHREILQELDEKLADKLFCNFSLFQSMPDAWGIEQIFPILPIHRLDEKPERRAVIQDLTCDSDGRVDFYVERQNIEKTLAVHTLKPNEMYLIGFFMLGAYQEILGDMHNLFGDTHSLNIELTKDGYTIADFLEGEHVSDLLDYVHINRKTLQQAYAEKLQSSAVSVAEKSRYLNELLNALKAYTYLEK
ncbi:biosynthetic arginine decarboxylase [methane-oxidizing endosymbiont of Gigantopelta aegis]|uniref:biosynthetic arginine decarboxylase n=1 Tax=methane-oxidizing endosymbiont of Gigantopelta aegis TaxID=2794938 RepID=UPI0018DEBFD6|nr:biosynthetic arginine decarboxylase [methane-oxidizing endosymbiont of Gigantopelta aegis]